MQIIKIGRDSQCNIRLGDGTVSAFHAEITVTDSGDYLLEDRGSTNGTFLAGKPIKPGVSVQVNRGDLIRFGTAELNWSSVPMPPDNSAYKGIFGIGSHATNTVRLSGNTVSRYHATVKWGRDGKVYLFDHSRNGTTVNGNRVARDTPYRIRRSDTIVCGGVPARLDTLPVWSGSSAGKVLGIIGGIVAAAAIVVCVFLFLPKGKKAYTDSELYAMYNNRVVLIFGTYHYEATAGDYDLTSVGMPTKFIVAGGQFVDVTEASQSVISQYSSYNGTGFFVSQDGKIVTNLHVVKPWLFGGALEQLENSYRETFARLASKADIDSYVLTGSTTNLSAVTSLIKIKGVLDGIFFVPQGAYLSTENAIDCHVLTAGTDTDIDVALIQSDRKELPNGCAFVNVTDSLDDTPEACKPGNHIYTIGFPYGLQIQDRKAISVLGHGGSVTKSQGAYSFASFELDAAVTHGASGSPVFNDEGKLIGIVNAMKDDNLQGFNFGIRAEYIRKLLQAPERDEE